MRRFRSTTAEEIPPEKRARLRARDVQERISKFVFWLVLGFLALWLLGTYPGLFYLALIAFSLWAFCWCLRAIWDSLSQPSSRAKGRAEKKNVVGMLVYPSAIALAIVVSWVLFATSLFFGTSQESPVSVSDDAPLVVREKSPVAVSQDPPVANAQDSPVAEQFGTATAVISLGLVVCFVLSYGIWRASDGTFQKYVVAALAVLCGFAILAGLIVLGALIFLPPGTSLFGLQGAL